MGWKDRSSRVNRTDRGLTRGTLTRAVGKAVDKVDGWREDCWQGGWFTERLMGLRREWGQWREQLEGRWSWEVDKVIGKSGGATFSG